MQYLEHTSIKRLIVIYLKFNFNWVFSILPDNATPSVLRLEARLLLTACQACVIWPCLSPSIIIHHPLLHDHIG